MQEQKTNSGGVLAAEDVIGRDEVTAAIWRILDSQGIYLTGERRMGKTSIVRDKMGQVPHPGYKTVYMDVAKIDTPIMFANAVLQHTKNLPDNSTKFKAGGLDLFQRLPGGIEIGSLKIPGLPKPDWREVLAFALNAFASDKIQRYVLVFDELPIMLDKIKRRGSTKDAMGVLDTLRQQRQSDNRYRMIYTGSLGLHHVLTDLQDDGYQNDPTNDLRSIQLEPLSETHATLLALRLLNGAGISCVSRDALALHIGQIAGGMPYYIQHIVSGLLTVNDATITTKTVDDLLEFNISDLSDHWHFGYYKERIDTHYQPAARPTAFALLDQLAVAHYPLALDDLMSGLNPAKVKIDEATVRRTLILLGKDHYINQIKGGMYQFRYPLIARAWINNPYCGKGEATN